MSSAIAPGGSAVLTSGAVGQAATGTVQITYTGSATSTITGVSITGTSAISVSSAPSFPVTLSPNGTATFTIQYLPFSGAAATGQLAIAVTEGTQASVFSFNVTGNTPDLKFNYSLLPSGGLNSIDPDGSISFPTNNVGATSTAIVTIVNRGSATGSLLSVIANGPDYQATGFSVPVQLAPGQQTSFNLLFTAHRVGVSTGILTLGLNSKDVTFNLTGAGATTNASISYSLGDGNTVALLNGSTISFPSVDVNGTSTAAIDIFEQGTGSSTVGAIQVSGSGFRASGVPLLPATVGAGQHLRFDVVFAPAQTGTFGGSLQLNLNGTIVTAALSGSTSASKFSVSYTLSDGNAQSFSDRGVIAFPATDLKATSTATLTVTNQGKGSGNVTGIFLEGPGFSLGNLPLFPVAVGAGQTLRFTIAFSPPSAGAFSGSFRIDTSDGSISGSLSGRTAAASLTVSYIDPVNNSTFPLSNGTTLAFPDTLANSAGTTVVISVDNTGKGTGSINSVSVSGSNASSFQLISLPTFPVSIQPGQQLRFGVRFIPLQQQAFSAALAINLDGQTITIPLKAQGTGPKLTYSWSSSGVAAAVSPGETIHVADTAVGQTSSITIRVANEGTADSVVSSISVSGQGFSLSDVPAVPFTIKPGGTPQQFTIKFGPVQAGAAAGRFTVGSDSFLLAGTGVGSKLTYTYGNAASSISVAEGGSVLFTPLTVGSTGTVKFTVQNDGTAPATLSSINLAAPSSIFSLQGLPALPISLAAGASATFSISFVPNTVGTLTAILRVNEAGFTLTGTGTQPPPLPSFDFQPLSGTQQPAQQLGVGLSLSAAYPMALQGSLTLSFVSSVFADDAAVQFATGGRTVKFTIPANSTQALFGNNATSIPIQTGTVAGNIVITPSFAMQSGGFDVTPTPPPALTLAVGRLAPQLLNASITNRAATSFQVLVNGYSTTRAVRQLDIVFTPRSGANFTSTHLTVDVTSASAAWFQSAASEQAFGGTFSMLIPFTLQNGDSGVDLVQQIQALSITATNEVGTSNSVTAAIP